MHEIIDLLQSKRLIWQGSQQRETVSYVSSCYTNLDQKLGGGFPTSGVVEIISEIGIGELRFITPYIKKNQQQGLTVFINPPSTLCAEYFAQQGVSLNTIVSITTKTKTEALWAAEQCLKSGSCSSVMLWQPLLEVHQVKRLQLASETGHCLFFSFSNNKHQQFGLPITLSLRLDAQDTGLCVHIDKRKGGWIQASCFIDMQTSWSSLFPHTPLAGKTDTRVIPFTGKNGRQQLAISNNTIRRGHA